MDKDTRQFTEETETEGEFDIRQFKKKESSLFFSAVKLVAIGIILYVSLTHLNIIWDALGTVYTLLRPLLYGGLIAMILNALMSVYEKIITLICTKLKLKIKYRPIEILSLILTLLSAVLLIYIIVNSVLPQLVDSTKEIISMIQKNWDKIYAVLDKVESYGIDTAPIEEWLSEIKINELVKQFSSEAMNIINTVVSGASTVVSGTFTAVTSVIFAVYVLANKRSLSRQSKKLAYAYLKKSFVDRTIGVCRLTIHTFTNFISGQCLDAIILGIMTFIAMSIFRFPYALAIASMIIVTAIIPYVGAFIGGAFGVLLMIMDDPMRAVWFVVLFIVVQQIDNHIVYPRVVGGSVGLPAIWTFAAVILGGSLFGPLGMVLFIPLFSVIYTLIRGAVHARLEKRGIVVEDTIKDEEADIVKTSKLQKLGKKIKDSIKGIFKKKEKPTGEKPDEEKSDEENDQPNE